MLLKRLLSVGLILLAAMSCSFESAADTYYFDLQDNSWSTVKVYAWDTAGANPTGAWSGTEISAETIQGHTFYKYEYTGSTPLAGIIFNNGADNNGIQTEDLKPKDGSVYTLSDAKDSEGVELSAYIYALDNPDDPDNPDNPGDTTKRYWITPENATQKDKVVLHFVSSNGSGKLGNFNDDLYVHIGVCNSSAPNTWTHASSWGNNDDKYKMTKESDYNYSLTLGPTLEQYFGCQGEEICNIAVIFRNKDGGKDDDNDIFIPIKVIPQIPESGELGSYASHTDENGTLTVNGTKGILQLTPFGKDIIKVFTFPSLNPDRQERASVGLVSLTPAENIGYTVTEDDDCLYLSVTGGTIVKVTKKNLLVTFTTSDGRELLSEKGGLVNKKGNVSITFNAAGDAAFYGGGYYLDNANRNNQTMTMNNNQNWGYNSDYSTHNICIPVIISSNGYGIYFDSQYRNANIRPSSNGGTTYSSASPDPISYFFLGGGTMQAAVSNYLDLTGHQMLPPVWALGYITSRYSFESRSVAKEVISNTKEKKFPLDGIVFDIHWQGDESKMGKIDWGEKYSNPSEMMSNFLSQGVHTIAITEPFFTSSCGNYDFLKNNGYLADHDVSGMEWLKSDKVGLLDVTKREALDWFWQLYKARTEEGMEGWWLDLGEPERHDDDSSFGDGSSNAQIHNEYGNIWTASVFEGMRHDFPDKRVMLMPRSGTAGMQRYSSFPWTGDIQRSWEGLRGQIPSLINASMSGIGYLGSDVGGFAGDNIDADLYERWVEFAVFSPMMRTHSANNPMPYLDCYSSQHDNIRKMLNLRYSYLPYFYTRAYEYTANGTPLCVPANFYDTDKERLADCKDEFLLGRDLLVAPNVDQGSSRNITFPEGRWFDLNDNKSIYSGSKSGYSAPMGTLPHFARLGSLIMRYAQDTYTCTRDINRSNLRLDFFNDDDDVYDFGTFTFYDDDHETPDPITDGKYLLTKVNVKNQDGSLLFDITKEGELQEGMPDTHNLQFTIHNYLMFSADKAAMYVDEYNQNSSVPLEECSSLEDFNNKVAERHNVTAMTRKAPAGQNIGGIYFNDRANSKVYADIRVPAANNAALAIGSPDVITEVDTIEVEENLSVEYYTPEGFRVTNPVKGQLLIMRKGSRSYKIVY